MSIRLGNGRIVHAPLYETYVSLLAARPAASDMGRDLQHAWITRRAVQLIDDADRAGVDRPAHPLAAAWNALAEAQREIRQTQRRNPDCDFEFELWLFPISARHTLIMVQTEQRAMSKWFDALPFVFDHGYWDGVDRPDTMTAAIWTRRRRDWKTAMPNGIPSERCLGFVMFNHQHVSMPSADEALKHVEDKTVRARRIAGGLHVDEEHVRLLAQRREKEPDYKPDGFALLFEATDAADSNEDRRAEITAKTSAELRDISAGDLVPAF